MNSPPLPKVTDLEAAHRKLITEYISAIDRTRRLPFFVDFKALLKSRDDETSYERWSRRFFSRLSAPFCWRPFVQFLVELHIKEKLNELSAYYAQLSMQLPDKREFSKLRSWLLRTSSECNTLKDTLTTWKNGQILISGAVPILLAGITSWLGADNLLAILPKLNYQLSQLSFLSNSLALTIFGGVFLSVFFLFSLLNFAFEGKRAVFLPYYVVKKIDIRQNNIYATEDDVYRLIGRKKTTEFPVDAYAASVVVFIVLICLAAIRSIIVSIPMTVIVLIMIVFLISAIYPSRHRWN